MPGRDSRVVDITPRLLTGQQLAQILTAIVEIVPGCEIGGSYGSVEVHVPQPVVSVPLDGDPDIGS